MTRRVQQVTSPGRDENAAAEIDAHYRVIERGFLERDVDVFLAGVGEGATYRDGDRLVPYAQVRDFWTWRFAEMHQVQAFKLKVTQLDDETAEGYWVTYVEEGEATVRLPGGGIGQRRWRLHSRDLWVRGPAGFRVTDSQDLDVRRTLDGTPLAAEKDPIGMSRWRSLQAVR